MDDSPPRKTAEVLPLDTVFSPQTLFLASLAVALLVIAAVTYYKRSLRPKGTDLLLLGAPDAGKTSILTTLAYGQTLPTHTSLQTNSSICTLPTTRRSFRIIDVPGHPRIKDQFREHLAHAKVIAFVVDSSSISRNGAAVAEHLHLILHTLTSLPPSQTPPSLLIVAHKIDLLKTASSTINQPENLAINRVKTILERELEKRRVSQSGGVGVESLGAEDEKVDMGGLECGGGTGVFKFDEWAGGDIPFVSTHIQLGQISNDDEKSSREDGLAGLWEWLAENL